MHASDQNGWHCRLCGQPITERSSDPRDSKVILSVLIPVRNESDQVAQNLSLIHAEASKTGLPTEMIVVDDGSTDNTWHVLESVDEQWDIVEGIKRTRGTEPLINKIGARFFYRTLSRLSGYDLYGSSDFKLLDRKVIDAWLDMRERNTFFRGMISWLGYRRKQITFSVPRRKLTQSRWSFFSLFRLAIVAITAFSSLPLQAVTLLGGLFLFCAILFSGYALLLYFTGLALPGFTTVIILEMLIGGVLMVSLGIIGTYIAQIYQEVKYRPRYVVAETLAIRGDDKLSVAPENTRTEGMSKLRSKS